MSLSTRSRSTVALAVLGLVSLGLTVLVEHAAAAAAPAVPPTVVVSAHRGGAAYAPENTMVAYRNALRLGVDQYETDTQLTKDGKLVLLHDASLDRTTDCTGNVQDHTLAEVQACDAGFDWTPGQGVTQPNPALPHPLRGHGVGIPEAHELFDVVRAQQPTGATTISIEIKDIPGEANFDETGTKVAAVLVPLIQASGLKARTIVQSFYPPALNVVKAMDSSIKTQLLTVGATTPYLTYGVVTTQDIISPSSTNPDLNPTTVATAHAAGKQVIPYTPDTATELTSVGAYGVDGEITNFPACLLQLEGRPVASRLIADEAAAAGSPDSRLCADSSAQLTATLPEAPATALLAVAALLTVLVTTTVARRRRHSA